MKPTVTCVCSVRLEEELLSGLLLQRAWFASSGIRVFIPPSVAAGKKTITSSAPTLRVRKKWLERSWRGIEKDFFTIMSGFRYRKILRKYQCQVTYFGCEGQYRPPDRIIVRLHTTKDKRSATETIGHELLHLSFHDFFRQKRFGYAEREGMVDALMMQSPLHKLFPGYRRQPMGKIHPRILSSILRT